MQLATDRLILRDFTLDDRPAVEADIGYELSPRHWGHGYATEAA
jgi:predicted acetyltransferase